MAATRMMDEHVELLRLELTHDLRRLMRTAAVGMGGLVAVGVATGAGAVAAAWVLTLWLPLGAAMGLVALVSATAGALFTRKARALLPSSTPLALPAADRDR